MNLGWRLCVFFRGAFSARVASLALASLWCCKRPRTPRRQQVSGLVQSGSGQGNTNVASRRPDVPWQEVGPTLAGQSLLSHLVLDPPSDATGGGGSRGRQRESPFGLFEDSFSTSCSLISGRLVGSWFFGPVRFSPSASVVYLGVIRYLVREAVRDIG
jgi:hypothetical protein